MAPKGLALGLAGQELEEFVEEAHQLVRNYFVLEDPNASRSSGPSCGCRWT